MPQDTMLRELFDRWERVWHEGQYDLISECVPLNYIRHDEVGDRTLMRAGFCTSGEARARRISAVICNERATKPEAQRASELVST